eukprot:738722-Pelagomonas_calceolata.AAC.4
MQTEQSNSACKAAAARQVQDLEARYRRLQVTACKAAAARQVQDVGSLSSAVTRLKQTVLQIKKRTAAWTRQTEMDHLRKQSCYMQATQTYVLLHPFPPNLVLQSTAFLNQEFDL